ERCPFKACTYYGSPATRYLIVRKAGANCLTVTTCSPIGNADPNAANTFVISSIRLSRRCPQLGARQQLRGAQKTPDESEMGMSLRHVSTPLRPIAISSR